MSKSSNLLVLFFIVNGCLVITELKAEESGLACGAGVMTGLREKKHVVECEVKSRITITGAKINKGGCLSPIEYIDSYNKQRKTMNLPNFVALKDFRRSYLTGETFYFVVPEACTLTEFTISTSDKDYTWQTQ